MNWFQLFVDYCKVASNTNQLQQYLTIWDDRYPSVIRRCLAMDLKKRLLDGLHGAQAPSNDLITTMAKQLNDLHTIVMSTPVSKIKLSKTKKPTKDEKLAKILEKRAFVNITKSN